VQDIAALNVLFRYSLTVILRVCNFRLHCFHIYICLPIFNSDHQILFRLTYRHCRKFSLLVAFS